ncbi:hypothetical protein T190115A13A_10084 [Tenacibaculum sp. 190524A02b]|uniref:Uncharacterized protein n=1 Tax=Tenacibaculum vairaonense TaxID=3137860 RepID=A0ABP1F8F1_9FLAO
MKRLNICSLTYTVYFLIAAKYYKKWGSNIGLFTVFYVKKESKYIIF